MPSNRYEKNQNKRRSFDLKQRERIEEGEEKEAFRHKSHKEMRYQRKRYDRDLTQEELEQLKTFLQEYTTLSPFRIQYKMNAFTVPDFSFFIKNPEEFLRGSPRFGDVFEARNRRNRWIRGLLARELGADRVNKFLDGLDDQFLQKFVQLKSNCQFDSFQPKEDGDLVYYLTEWVQKQAE